MSRSKKAPKAIYVVMTEGEPYFFTKKGDARDFIRTESITGGTFLTYIEETK